MKTFLISIFCFIALWNKKVMLPHPAEHIALSQDLYFDKTSNACLTTYIAPASDGNIHNNVD